MNTSSSVGSTFLSDRIRPPEVTSFCTTDPITGSSSKATFTSTVVGVSAAVLWWTPGSACSSAQPFRPGARLSSKMVCFWTRFFRFAGVSQASTFPRSMIASRSHSSSASAM